MPQPVDDHVFTFNTTALCLIDIDPPETTREIINNACWNGTVVTYRPAHKYEFSQITFNYKYEPADADHQAIVAAAKDQETDHTLTFELVGVGEFVWTGFVVSHKPNFEESEDATATVVFQPNSETWTADGGGA